MKTEIEVKFLDVDFDRLRQSLARENAHLEQPMRLMRRVIIETPELAAQNSFIRVRDEGDKVTLTYKRFDGQSLTGAKEIELTVSSFNDAIAFLEQIGLAHKSFQESRRETWRLGDVEIVLDEWPWLNPYVEIEGESEARVKEVAALLGFNWEDAVFGSATTAYQAQYPNGDASQLVNIPLVAFDQPLPAIISGEDSDNEKI